MMGLPQCMTFGGPRVEAAVANELLRAAEPLAVEAGFGAEQMHRERQDDKHRILDLELQHLRQACWEANLAERRYAACDPDNRLIAASARRPTMHKYDTPHGQAIGAGQKDDLWVSIHIAKIQIHTAADQNDSSHKGIYIQRISEPKITYGHGKWHLRV